MLDYPPGWTCEKTGLRFERYILQTILLEEALAVAEHLEACAGCAQSLVLYRLTITPASRG
jgi:hypothetical protein